MRDTTIVFAQRETLSLLAEEGHRFSGTRSGIKGRLYAAWLVFSGQADALMWDGEYFIGDPYGEQVKPWPSRQLNAGSQRR
jgi:hypothetical protein